MVIRFEWHFTNLQMPRKKSSNSNGKRTFARPLTPNILARFSDFSTTAAPTSFSAHQSVLLLPIDRLPGQNQNRDEGNQRITRHHTTCRRPAVLRPAASTRAPRTPPTPHRTDHTVTRAALTREISRSDKTRGPRVHACAPCRARGERDQRAGWPPLLRAGGRVVRASRADVVHGTIGDCEPVLCEDGCTCTGHTTHEPSGPARVLLTRNGLNTRRARRRRRHRDRTDAFATKQTRSNQP